MHPAMWLCTRKSVFQDIRYVCHITHEWKSVGEWSSATQYVGGDSILQRVPFKNPAKAKANCLVVVVVCGGQKMWPDQEKSPSSILNNFLLWIVSLHMYTWNFTAFNIGSYITKRCSSLMVQMLILSKLVTRTLIILAIWKTLDFPRSGHKHWWDPVPVVCARVHSWEGR